MRTIKFRLSLGLGALGWALLCSPRISAQTDALSTNNVQVSSRMEEIVQTYVSAKLFMGSVLVARGNEVLLNRGYGSANLEWSIPNSPSTKFRLASITKQFTAAAILLLEQQGKLSVDDPVKKYLPDAPAAWEKITIFHLLTHTSGIPNFTDFTDYQFLKSLPVTPEQLVARFRDRPLDFQPDERWNYSNSGYALLGYLIEQISGQSYAEFLRENIFAPLGMNDSGYDWNFEIIPQRAEGYRRNQNSLVIANFIHMSIPFSAGGLFSTTEDLLRWEQGLFGGKVLPSAALERMTTPYKNSYGFGVGKSTVNGRTLLAHGGGIEGFSTLLVYYPDDQLTVVLLANLEGVNGGLIADQLASVAYSQK